VRRSHLLTIVARDPRCAQSMLVQVRAIRHRGGMDTLTHDPVDGIYPTTSDYAHALELREPRRLLLVSGTMGLDAGGAPGATLTEQVALIWSNLRRILASAGMTTDHVMRVTSYLRDAAYTEENARARIEALGGRVVPTTAIVVETLEPDWLVEVEIIAAA
jgi:2-iminobutanoate/2-iminopropanoate deaminase